MGRAAAMVGVLASLVLAPSLALASDPAPPAGGESSATDTAPPPGDPADPAVPEPELRKADLKVRMKGLRRGKLNLGKKLVVVAKLTPAVAGEQVRFRLKGGHGRKATKKSVGRAGKARFTVRPHEQGPFRVKVFHPESTRLSAAKARSKRFKVRYRLLELGDRGRDVRFVNSHLRGLGFVTSKGAKYTQATVNAILAYRKANGLRRVGWADPHLMSNLMQSRGGVKLRHPGAGKHIEADLSRQILILAKKGRAVEIYHTSSGKPGHRTPTGRYEFHRYEPGYNNKGMYYSAYFVGGYAIHGYDPVPIHPASHGCLRVPIPNAVHIYKWIHTGMPIFLYH